MCTPRGSIALAELPRINGESECLLTVGAVLRQPSPKAQPLLPAPIPRDAGIHLWKWDCGAGFAAQLAGPQRPGPRSSCVREELERVLLLQHGFTHKLSDVHPETLCFRHGDRRSQEESLILLHNCKVNQMKRGDSYISAANTACSLSSGKVLHEKEEKTKLRTSISSLFSDSYHTQKQDLPLLFVCGLGMFLLKRSKLQCLFPEFSGAARSGSTPHRMPLGGARRRSTYFVSYKWPQAEKQLPACLTEPRGRDLRAKAATEIKEAKEVFCCNLKCLQFLRKVNRLGGLLWVGSHSQV